MAKIRVIDCNNCGEPSVPEAATPLRLSFSKDRTVAVFGFKHFHCQRCGTYFATREVGLEKITQKAREAAFQGSNTIVL